MTFSQNNTKHYSIQSNNSSLPSIYIDQLVAMAAAPSKTNLNPTYQSIRLIFLITWDYGRSLDNWWWILPCFSFFLCNKGVNTILIGKLRMTITDNAGINWSSPTSNMKARDSQLIYPRLKKQNAKLSHEGLWPNYVGAINLELGEGCVWIAYFQQLLYRTHVCVETSLSDLFLRA